MTTDNHHQQLADDALKKYDKESNAFEHTGFMAKFVSALAICFSVFQLYTAVFGVLDALIKQTQFMGISSLPETASVKIIVFSGYLVNCTSCKFLT